MFKTFENWTKWELAPNANAVALLLLLFVAFIGHYYLLSRKLTVLVSHVILNGKHVALCPQKWDGLLGMGKGGR